MKALQASFSTHLTTFTMDTWDEAAQAAYQCRIASAIKTGAAAGAQCCPASAAATRGASRCRRHSLLGHGFQPWQRAPHTQTRAQPSMLAAASHALQAGLMWCLAPRAWALLLCPPAVTFVDAGASTANAQSFLDSLTADPTTILPADVYGTVSVSEVNVATVLADPASYTGGWVGLVGGIGDPAEEEGIGKPVPDLGACCLCGLWYAAAPIASTHLAFAG